MWTEIVNKDICVTHVAEYQVVTPIGDVSQYDMREVQQQLEERAALEHQLERAQNFGEQIEQDLEFHEKLTEVIDNLEEEFGIERSEKAREAGRRMAHLPD